MPERARAQTDYCCIHCMAALWENGRAELGCHDCGRCFPVVHGIPILTLRPREMLMVHLQEFRQAQAALERKRVLLSAPAKYNSAARIERMLNALTQNLGLIDTYVKPIEEYLNSNGQHPPSLIDWALAQNIGSVPQIMLPFFYQDWARTRDMEDAESLVTDALLQYRPDDETVAVLGAGACGMTYASAKHFGVAYGLDLSLPTLLMAQGIMAGDTIAVHVANAGWERVQLTPPNPAKNEICLVAADIGTLPFAEGNLSAVITQYLMDVAGDPLGVAAEIQRVLKPGGIWVNFSNPFRLPGDPPETGLPEPEELPELFEPFGLEIIKVRRTRFTLLNLDQIYAGGHRNAQEVHFFVARKAALPGRTIARRFQIWDRQNLDSWWQLVPEIIPGREIQVLRKRVFAPGGAKDGIEIAVNAVNFSISGEHTAFVETLFGQFDGERTLLEILNNLVAQGIAMRDTEFRELIHCLLNQYCVISLNSQTNFCP